MSRKSRLPTICRWIFTVCTVLSLIGAAVVVIMMVIGPFGTSKGGAHLSGEVSTELTVSPPPGTLMLQSNSGRIYASEVSAIISDKDAGPLRRLAQTYGLPLDFIYMAFLAVVFDLLRRLFRNVERGESFTPQTMRLVRITGLSLVVFSLLSAVVDSMFSSAVIDYMRTHAVLSGAGIKWLEPASHEVRFHFKLESPVFFAGLLVLALSEVFRQGLALKNENDLTI